MNDELKKICDAIGALPEDATVEFRLIDGRTNTLLDSWDIDDLKALASYALRVEKMLEAAERVVNGAEYFLDRDGVIDGAVKSTAGAIAYKALAERIQSYRKTAFEATQDDSNGR